MCHTSHRLLMSKTAHNKPRKVKRFSFLLFWRTQTDTESVNNFQLSMSTSWRKIILYWVGGRHGDNMSSERGHHVFQPWNMKLGSPLIKFSFFVRIASHCHTYFIFCVYPEIDFKFCLVSRVTHDTSSHPGHPGHAARCSGDIGISTLDP